jgi:hypothetical protein
MSTLLQLRSQVRTGLRTTDPNARVWSDTLLDQYINEAVSTIQQDGSFDWHFNEGSYSVASVIGTHEYDLPDDFARMESLGVKYDNSMLVAMDYRVVFDFYSLTQQGTPGIYYLRDDKFGVLSVPDSVKTMAFLYRKVLPLMIDDLDDSGMPQVFDEAISRYALYLCWTDITNNDMATQSFNRYKTAMEGNYTQYLGRRDEANFQFGFAHVNTGNNGYNINYL